jgi:hypothetical protein
MPDCHVTACPRNRRFNNRRKENMSDNNSQSGRIIGLDMHPDIYSAAAAVPVDCGMSTLRLPSKS